MRWLGLKSVLGFVMGVFNLGKPCLGAPIIRIVVALIMRIVVYIGNYWGRFGAHYFWKPAFR